jgi:methionine biosynthesis protein MetW
MSPQDYRKVRHDFELIAGWITPSARVLDLGCGDGALLNYLKEQRQVNGYGIEIEPQSVTAAIANNVNVLQLDIESGLSIFNDHSFDAVVLSLTLQAIKNTEKALLEMARVGREVIVSFPNFGYWRHRLDIVRGRMPVSDTLPYAWYNTPNVRQFTINDFDQFVAQLGLQVKARQVFTDEADVNVLPNLRGAVAVYRLQSGLQSGLQSSSQSGLQSGLKQNR